MDDEIIDAERILFLDGMDIDHDIKELERMISLGGDVDYLKEILQMYLEHKATMKPDDDDPDLRDLPADVTKRVKTLKGYLQMPEYQVDIVNIEAIIKAYIDGSLEIRPGYRTYWAGGRRKSDYVKCPGATGENPNEVILQWVKEENGHRAWREYPGDTVVQMAAMSTSFLPSNENSHHQYRIRVRSPQAGTKMITVTVLDDTGSDFLEIFGIDLMGMKISKEYFFILQPVKLTTTSTPVIRQVIWLLVQLLDPEDNPIGGWFNVEAVHVPGLAKRFRTSGMFVRKNLFTATAPDGQGLLYVSEKKTGVVRQLPAV